MAASAQVTFVMHWQQQERKAAKEPSIQKRHVPTPKDDLLNAEVRTLRKRREALSQSLVPCGSPCKQMPIKGPSFHLTVALAAVGRRDVVASCR